MAAVRGGTGAVGSGGTNGSGTSCSAFPAVLRHRGHGEHPGGSCLSSPRNIPALPQRAARAPQSPLVPPSPPLTGRFPLAPARLVGDVRSGVQLGTGLGAGWVPAPALTATLCPQRKPACLACYKFDNSDVPKVLDKYHNCGPSHHLAVKEIKQRDEAECRAVEEAGKSTDVLYLPGMFAFSRGMPA
uniref:Retinoic acid receptor responder protein 2 n=1 Tax=Anser brachyrhynchus TaxID=132585 RepID=A0A8B9BZN7_9AVES